MKVLTCPLEHKQLLCASAPWWALSSGKQWRGGALTDKGAGQRRLHLRFHRLRCGAGSWSQAEGRSRDPQCKVEGRVAGSLQEQGKCVFVKVEEGPAWCEHLRTDPVWHRKWQVFQASSPRDTGHSR